MEHQLVEMFELHWTRWLNVLDWSIMKKKPWKKPRMENPYNLKYSQKIKEKKNSNFFLELFINILSNLQLQTKVKIYIRHATTVQHVHRFLRFFFKFTLYVFRKVEIIYIPALEGSFISKILPRKLKVRTNVGKKKIKVPLPLYMYMNMTTFQLFFNTLLEKSVIIFKFDIAQLMLLSNLA